MQARDARRSAIVAAAAALAAVAAHLACGNRYGVFRDELYFLACGRHLAWGYVDQPPAIALAARVAETLFGTSPLGLRLLAFAAHAATVVAVAALARRLGGGPFAVALAGAAALASPALLATGHLLTMNAFEPLLWTALALAVLRAVERPSLRRWVAVGALVGLGLLDKYSMAFWAAALVAGLLATRERRVLAGSGVLAAAAVAAALALPNLLWQVRHGLPMLEVLRHSAGRHVPFTWAGFSLETLLEQNPLAAPLWLAGLAWLLFFPGGVPPPGPPVAPACPRICLSTCGLEGGQAPPPGPALRTARHAWLGIAFVAVSAEIALLHGKPYYLAPAFPVLLAAGGCAVERWIRPAAARAAALVALLASGAAVAPLAIPVLPISGLLRWQAALGVKPSVGETLDPGALPQLFADQTGWPELVRSVDAAWRTLPPDDRAHGAILARNYGQAGAIDLYGPALGLPRACSGHNSYWLWGPPPQDARTVLAIGGSRAEWERGFARVERVGETPDSPFNMVFERREPLWLLAAPRAPLPELWSAVRAYR